MYICIVDRLFNHLIKYLLIMNMYYDQDRIIRHTTTDSTITGKNGDVIQVGDTVQYMNNPHCKPETVVDFFQDTIICTGGRGDAEHYRLISKRHDTKNIIRQQM